MPVALSFLFAFEPPKSTSKKKRDKMLSGEIRHVKKPDVSNCVKFTEDCLKGTVIYDDSQVVSIRAKKFYAEKAETKIFVIKMGDEDATENGKKQSDDLKKHPNRGQRRKT
jgi:Holliday junction resolvase RusA-like endonuclease